MLTLASTCENKTSSGRLTDLQCSISAKNSVAGPSVLSSSKAVAEKPLADSIVRPVTKSPMICAAPVTATKGDVKYKFTKVFVIS